MPPVVIMGMHRSGTTLIGTLLEQLGLFVGSKKDTNNESIFFRQINAWLLSQCGGRWDNPATIQYLLGNRRLLGLTEHYVRLVLRSPRAFRFLGTFRYVKVRDICRLDIPWGWKDPRNTFTAPFWLRIFPDAKVITLERHGVDVAESLRRRGEQGFLSVQERYNKLATFYMARNKRDGFLASPRCARLEGGLSLWHEYQEQVSRVVSGMAKNRVLRIRYEDLLQNPEDHMMTAARFCGLEVSGFAIAQACQGIDIDRAFAYRRSQELVSFARRHASTLQQCGYPSGE